MKCSIAGCDLECVVKGMCNPHYQSARKYGDPLRARRSAVVHRPNGGHCSIYGCDHAPRSASALYCEMHYYRQRRGGDPLLVRKIVGRTLCTTGYIKVRAADHPLASRGWLAEHRKVLFEAIGQGAHPCHWCGVAVDWSKHYPTHSDGLVVDHLDGVKTNNNAGNLVPSCAMCNLKRGRVLAKNK